MNVYHELGYLRKSKSLLYSAIALSLSVCSLISLIGSKSFVWDLVSLMCWALLVFVGYFVLPEIFTKYLHFWVMSTWAILAVYFLENGNVVLRGEYSYHYGSLPIYLLSWLIFFSSIFCLEIRHKNRLAKKQDARFSKDQNMEVSVSKPGKMVMYISYLMLALLVMCFLSIANKPYFLLDVDRFAYKKIATPWFVSMLSPWFYCFIPVVMMTRKRDKKVSLIYLALLGALCVWQGEKFSGLLRMIFYVMISVSPQYVGMFVKRHIRKIIKIVAMVVLSLLLIVVAQQILLYDSDLAMLSDYFEDRLAAQGELWWLTYRSDVHSGWHLDEINDEVSIWIHQPDTSDMEDYNFGIYKLMKKFMNSNWVSYSLPLGIRATEATRAFFFYYGKTAGLVVGQALLGVLVYFVVSKCSYYSNRNNLLKAVLYLYVLQGVFLQYIWRIFNY